MIEKGLIAWLLTQSTVTSYVGTSVFPVRAPQHTPYPLIRVQRVSGEEVSSLAGPSGLCYPRIQISCDATDYATARSLAQAVKTALDGFKGSMGTFVVQGAHYDNETDHETPPRTGEDQAIFSVMADYVIWYVES